MFLNTYLFYTLDLLLLFYSLSVFIYYVDSYGNASFICFVIFPSEIVTKIILPTWQQILNFHINLGVGGVAVDPNTNLTLDDFQHF